MARRLSLEDLLPETKAKLFLEEKDLLVDPHLKLLAELLLLLQGITTREALQVLKEAAVMIKCRRDNASRRLKISNSV